MIGLQRHSVPRCFGSEDSVQWMSPNYADPGTKLENRVPGRTKTPDVGDTLIS